MTAPTTTASREQAADQLTRTLHVLQWMRAAHIRPASLEVLLAVTAGHHTPAEIRQRTGLSPNGCWTACRVLIGRGQGRRNGENLLARCEPMLARTVDPHAGRDRCWLSHLTGYGAQGVEILTGAQLLDHPAEPAGPG